MIKEDLKFEGCDFKKTYLEKASYENCEFNGCDFMNSDLSLIVFSECSFKDCNLSNAKLGNTGFRQVTFTDCKMIGLQFSDCHHLMLAMNFIGCQLNFSSFYLMKFKSIQFDGCLLHQVDFSECQLPGIAFKDCDLQGAVFDGTNLEKADFSTAVNFTLNLEKNQIKKAKFSKDNLMGLVTHYDITIQ